ncbi:MAG: acyltransferase [bacterium]
MNQQQSIHPLADVQTATIGKDTRIWQYCVVLQGARIGSECNICSHVFIENDVVIGDRVTIKCGVQLWDGITIEDEVFIGPNATFTNDLNPRSRNTDFTRSKTFLKQGSRIGANATILPVTIGKWALVAAGSVVTKTVPDFALVVGAPAKIAAWMCRCGTKLEFCGYTALCNCHRTFEKSSETSITETTP